MAADKSPAFQFYPKDFLSSDAVSLMTTEQIGAYTLLLCHAWLRPEGLPASTAALAKLARCPQRRFEASIWPGLVGCFQQDATGGWTNARLEEERQKQAEFREAASRAGKRSAEQRAFNARSTPVGFPLQRPSNGNPTLQSSSAICNLQSSDQNPPTPLRGAVDLAGRGQWFWQEWRRLMQETSHIEIGLEPKAADIEAVTEVVEQVSENGPLLAALEKFMRLSTAQARDLNVRVKSVKTFRMALARLMQEEPVIGVTARTAGNMAALNAFVAKGQAS